VGNLVVRPVARDGAGPGGPDADREPWIKL